MVKPSQTSVQTLPNLGGQGMIGSMPSDPNAVTMNLSLPQPLKRYVDGKVSSGVYGSASEFVREAIREKLQRERQGKRTTADLTAKLIEGLDSGDPIAFTD